MSQIEIPKGWELKKLHEIAEIGQGGTPSRSKNEYWNGTIPWLRSGELRNNRINDSNEKITDLGLKNSSTKLCPKGTILMAMTGQGLTRGRTALLEIEACANQSCAHIINKNKDRLLTEFLWVFLQSKYWFIRSIHHGSGQPGINVSLIKQLEVPIPPLYIQKKIVQKLNYILKQLEEKKNKILKILEMKEKLLVILQKNTDVEFFEKTLKKYKKEGSNFKNVRLLDITSKITKGIFDLNPSNYASSGIPFLRISDIQENKINLNSVKFIPMEIHEKYVNTSLGPDDIILTKVGASAGSPEKIAMIPPNIKTANISQNLIGIRVDKKSIVSEYLLNYLKLKTMDKLIENCNVTTFKSIRLDILRDLVIELPDKQIQIKIVNDYLKIKNNLLKISVDKLSERNKFFLRSFSTFNSAIFNAAFSGKLVN